VSLEALLRPAAEEHRPVRRRRKVFLVSALVLLAILGVVAFITLATGLSSRRHFEDGRRLLSSAQAALLAGNADAAAADFGNAREAFLRAQHQPGIVLLRIEGLLPFVGRTPEALVSLSRIGAQVAGAGADVADGVGHLPDGLSSLGLHDGQIPLESLRSLAPSVRRARASLELAVREAARLPNSWLIGPVADARDLVRERLAQAVPLARSADAMLSSLPLFAGQGREARYFVGAQNSSELRGTGGFLGNYAILIIREGRISLGPFADAGLLPNLPAAKAPSPSKDFDDLYGPFGGGGFWLNINMTPDVPTAATLIEQMYQRVRGQKLDGTILFDLQGLTDLLRATGPVRSKPLNYTFTPENVVGYVATAAYLKSPVPNPFSEGPRYVAEAVWTRFLSSTDPEKAMRALISAAANGHLIFHGVDPKLQAAFRLAGVTGDFGARGSDFFGVVHSNAAANKVDYYLRQRLSYEVRLQPNGRAEATGEMTLENHAPVGARPGYVFGPSRDVRINGRFLQPGEDRTWTQFYCADDCRLSRSVSDGKTTTLEYHREVGLPVYAGFFEVKPARSRRVALSLQLPRAWDGDRATGTYRLRIQGQVSLPTTARVTIRAPEGMRIAWTSVPMNVDGSTATWSGPLDGARDFEVRFQRGFLSRAWIRVWSFLAKPVVHL
jgi:uncharacterized protein DUF4012